MDGGLRFGVRILMLWGVVIPQIALGAYVGLANTELYDVYSVCGRAWPLSPMTDQHLGGLITWIPGRDDERDRCAGRVPALAARGCTRRYAAGRVGGLKAMQGHLWRYRAHWRTLLVGALLTLALAGCGSGPEWRLRDVSGLMSELEFELTRAADGQRVTEQAYRGKVTVLFFGFTNRPDICPVTL